MFRYYYKVDKEGQFINVYLDEQCEVFIARLNVSMKQEQILKAFEDALKMDMIFKGVL